MAPKERIHLYVGDISLAETEAVVNAANTHLWMGAGVAGALLRRGGKVIEDEAIRQGPIKLGGAVITTGGSLNTKYVIHAAGMEPGGPATRGSVDQSCANSLKLAAENGIRSITFPAIGAGVGGLSIQDCAEVMLGRVIEHLKAKELPERVYFALFSEEIYDLFETKLEELLRGEGAGL